MPKRGIKRKLTPLYNINFLLMNSHMCKVNHPLEC